MAGDDIEQRVSMIKELLRLFRFERSVYITVTLLSLVVLLVSAVAMLLQGHAGLEVTALFVPAGAITYTAGRLLRMWSEALRVLYPALRQPEEK